MERSKDKQAKAKAKRVALNNPDPKLQVNLSMAEMKDFSRNLLFVLLLNLKGPTPLQAYNATSLKPMGQQKDGTDEITDILASKEPAQLKAKETYTFASITRVWNGNSYTVKVVKHAFQNRTEPHGPKPQYQYCYFMGEESSKFTDGAKLRRLAD